MYAQLGSFIIETTGPLTGLNRRRESVFAQHPVIEGKPVLQYVGDGLEEILLEFAFLGAFGDPAADVAELRALQERHEAVPLLFGGGDFLGHFVVQEVEETRRETDPDGVVTRAGVRVRLLEWPGDDALTRKRGAIATKSLQRARAKRSAPARPASIDPRAAAVGAITRSGLSS